MTQSHRIGIALTLTFATLTALLPAVWGQSTPTLRVNASEIQIGGRVQTQFNTSSVDGQPDGQFLLRRVYLDLLVRVNPLVSGKIQPDFSGDRATIKDAYLKLDFYPSFQLLAGKAYRNFSLIQQTSSTRILPIERGLTIRGVQSRDAYEVIQDLGYADRDIGVQVMGAPTGAPLGLSYAAGVFAGPLAARAGETDTYQYTGRATVRPLPRLTVGGGWSNIAFAKLGVDDVLEIQRGHALEVDAEYGAFAPGIHFLGELSIGDFDPFVDSEFLGAQAWLGYRTGAVDAVVAGIEPILRVSHSTIDSGGPKTGGTLITPGVNIYLGGLSRVMFNYDVWSPIEDAGTETSFKTMFQLAF